MILIVSGVIGECHHLSIPQALITLMSLFQELCQPKTKGEDVFGA